MTSTRLGTSTAPNSANTGDAPVNATQDSGGNSDSTARLVGIDVARAIAILGMFAAHVGPTDYDHPHSWAFLPFHGRAAVLFAVLAGISIAMMSRGAVSAGGGWRKALVRIGTRAILMLALGVVMNIVFVVPVWVILTYYGGFFLLSLPFLRWSARSLAIAAGVTIIGAPIVSWVIRRAYFPKTLVETPLRDLGAEQLTSFAGVFDFVTTLMLTGVFPTFIWIGYVFAGMAIGRLDLTSPRVAKVLTGVGVGLAVVSYGSSWLALNAFGGAEKIYGVLQAHADAEGIPVETYLQLTLFKVHGTPPTDEPAWLLLSSAHSGTPFDGGGSVGLALVVIGVALMLQPVAGKFLRPLAAVGALSLTCYIGHLVVMQLLWGGDPEYTALNAILFVVGSILFARVWRRWYGQGPMEKLVAKVSSAATKTMR